MGEWVRARSDQVGLQFIRGGEVVEVRDDEDHVFKGLGESSQEVCVYACFSLVCFSLGVFCVC